MDYLSFHKESAKLRDIDPANDCLKYISKRFELNIEQRYWLAFLYSTCYCGPTVYYMYNEFPDFENVNEARLQRWWKAHKKDLVFQSDRAKIRNFDHFVPAFVSYRALIGKRTQQAVFGDLRTPYPKYTYQQAFDFVTNVFTVGRFTAFIWLEMISVLTEFECEPDRLDWKDADVCFKGMCAAQGRQLSFNEADYYMSKYQSQLKCSIYNIETTLCAYKKHVEDRRYPGYYIDRQLEELHKMESNIKTGVHWGVLHQFRRETYKHLEDENNFSSRWSGKR